MKSRRSNAKMVADQPGMTWLFGGVLASIFIGLSLRFSFSQPRVTQLVDKAASHVGAGLKIQFSSASLSMADGLFPQFRVVIKDVHVQSENACWMSPDLKVDEINLPLSLITYLRENNWVESVIAKNAELHFRTAYQECNQVAIIPTAQPEAPKAEDASAVPGISIAKAAPFEGIKISKESKPTPGVNRLEIENLDIVYDPIKEISSSLKDIKAEKNTDNGVIELHSRTNFIKDDSFGDYLSHANIFLKYDPSGQPSWMFHFFGNWLEGRYSFISSYNPLDQNIHVQTDLKHIPLNQVIEFLKKYHFITTTPHLRQFWISAKTEVNADVKLVKDSPLLIKSLQLEGDLGEFSVDEFKLQLKEPYLLDPIAVKISQLNIEKLVKAFDGPMKSDIFSDLGIFEGEALIKSASNVELKGSIQDLGFIFSNKGNREVQKISKVSGQIVFKDQHWTGVADKIEPEGGEFSGNLHLKADQKFSDVSVQFKADKFKLNSNVERLMTSQGSLGDIQVDLALKVLNHKLASAQGELKMDKGVIDQIQFEKPSVKVTSSSGGIRLTTQVSQIVMDGNSAGAELLAPLRADQESKSNIALSNIKGEMTVDDQSQIRWKLSQGTWDESGRLSSEGILSPYKDIFGKVQLAGKGGTKSWTIHGARTNPILKREN